jgi:hypothetical protein
MQKITEDTLLPLGLLAAILSFALGATWWASSLYSRVAQAEVQIGSLEKANTDMLKELKTVNETLIEIRVLLGKKGGI